MTKKGQGISINTIIIAAIALAVLVVLFAIFTGRLGMFSRGVSETTSCQRACETLNMKIGTMSKTEITTCKNTEGRTYLAGTYGDITSDSICCCNR